MDLSTTYLGFKLTNPFVVGACPLADNLDTVKRLADAGVGAITMRSLFEEQLTSEGLATHRSMDTHAESFAEALTYFADPENFVLSHVAISEAVLSDDERRLGCILIDIGGGTCDISLFNRGILERVPVVPMAGSSITEDLAIGLKTTISNAEYIKTQYGNALASSVDQSVEIDVDGISGRESQRKTQYLLSHVIQHRVEEILANCYNKLKNHYTPELVTAGIVLTGGSARLQQIDQVVDAGFNMHVKIAAPDLSRLTGMISRLDDPAFATAVGLLYHAAGLERELKAPGFKLARLDHGKILDKVKKIIKDFTG